jgi:hypothetical protein
MDRGFICEFESVANLTGVAQAATQQQQQAVFPSPAFQHHETGNAGNMPKTRRTCQRGKGEIVEIGEKGHLNFRRKMGIRSSTRCFARMYGVRYYYAYLIAKM